MLSLEFFIDVILPIAVWSWGRLSLYRIEYQEYFRGVKRPVREADNLTPSCAVVTKSGSLNLLEPSGHFGPVMGLIPHYYYWDRGSTVVKVLCCKSGIAGSIPAGVIGIFHWYKILSIALWSWGRICLHGIEYQEYFRGGKNGRCVRLTTLPSYWAIVTKSGNLNFLEPSGHFGPVMGLIYLIIIIIIIALRTLSID